MADSATLPPSSHANSEYNGTANGGTKDYGAVNGTKAGYAPGTQGRTFKMSNLILALLLAVAIALAAAPVAGYKSGWAYYRRSDYVAPAQYRIPTAITLKIWCGWIKGSNSVTNILHRVEPQLVNEYTYLDQVKKSGQVAAGIAIAFLLLSGAVGFIYFLLALYHAARAGRTRSAVPPGLWIAGLIFGFFNMAWSLACYIVIAVGIAIYTRRTLGATYVAWPDWAFFLAFFSGVFWWIIAAVALAGRRRARYAMGATTGPNNMTHNMAYEGQQPYGTSYDQKPAAV